MTDTQPENVHELSPDKPEPKQEPIKVYGLSAIQHQRIVKTLRAHVPVDHAEEILVELRGLPVLNVMPNQKP